MPSVQRVISQYKDSANAIHRPSPHAVDRYVGSSSPKTDSSGLDHGKNSFKEILDLKLKSPKGSRALG